MGACITMLEGLIRLGVTYVSLQSMAFRHALSLFNLIEEITVTGTVFVLIATFFWALDTLIRYPLMEAGMSALHIVLTEHLILVILMVVWLRVRGVSLWAFARRDWLSLLVIGAFGSAIGTLAFTQAFSLMNPTLVILLQKLQPLVAISLAAWLLKEDLRAGFIGCVVVALAGSVLLVVEDIVQLMQTDYWHYSDQLKDRLWGYALALLAVVSWGASTVFGKQLSREGYRSDQIMFGRFLFGLIVLLPFLFWTEEPVQQVTVGTGAQIALMVLISGVLGMLFYYQGLQRIASRHSALAEMAFPVMAGVINWVFLGFELSALQIAGAFALIIASLLVHRTEINENPLPA